jgi:hypothetical protein
MLHSSDDLRAGGYVLGGLTLSQLMSYIYIYMELLVKAEI